MSHFTHLRRSSAEDVPSHSLHARRSNQEEVNSTQLQQSSAEVVTPREPSRFLFTHRASEEKQPVHYITTRSSEEERCIRPNRIKTTGTSNFRRTVTGQLNKPYQQPSPMPLANTDSYKRPISFKELNTRRETPIAIDSMKEMTAESREKTAQLKAKWAVKEEARVFSKLSASSSEEARRTGRLRNMSASSGSSEEGQRVGRPRQVSASSGSDGAYKTRGPLSTYTTTERRQTERRPEMQSSSSSERIPLTRRPLDTRTTPTERVTITERQLNTKSSFSPVKQEPVSIARQTLDTRTTSPPERVIMAARQLNTKSSSSLLERVPVSRRTFDTITPSQRMTDGLNLGLRSVREAERMINKVETQAMALPEDSPSNTTTTTTEDSSSWMNITIAVPRLWTRNPSKKLGYTFTWLGFILAMLATWFIMESVTCEIFCHPTTSNSVYWSPSDPFFPWAIPTKLDQWTGKYASRVLFYYGGNIKAAWDAITYIDNRPYIGKKVVYY